MIKEACVDNFEDAMRAIDKGANRLELCSRLDLDGLTPSIQLFHRIKSSSNIPVRIMIRPREGDFMYDSDEIMQMKKLISEFKKWEPDGFVFGVKKKYDQLDLDLTRNLVTHSLPYRSVIHKAIDSCKNIITEVDRLASLNMPLSILSSGGAMAAVDGVEVINQMQRHCNDKMKIIAAGKITSENVNYLASILLTDELHGRKIVE